LLLIKQQKWLSEFNSTMTNPSLRSFYGVLFVFHRRCTIGILVNVLTEV
jgi:hypothetical protein